MSVDARELDHVRWLGGGSGAGKSSVARVLAVRHPELVVVDTDALMADHARRADPASAPALARIAAATLDERWLGRTPAEMLESFHWYRGEAFDLLLADVAALPADRPARVHRAGLAGRRRGARQRPAASAREPPGARRALHRPAACAVR